MELQYTVEGCAICFVVLKCFQYFVELWSEILKSHYMFWGVGSTSVWSDLMFIIGKRVKSCFFRVLTLLSDAPCWFAFGHGSTDQELSKTVYPISLAYFLAALYAFKNVSGTRFKGHS